MKGGMSQFNKKELHIITFRQKCILNILSNIIFSVFFINFMHNYAPTRLKVNTQSNVLLQKNFYRNHLWNYTEELIVSHFSHKVSFFKYHHTALLIKKGGEQIEATIPSLLKWLMSKFPLINLIEWCVRCGYLPSTSLVYSCAYS
jgi:hypothetical protein